ncbi:unnamed protein product [Adineta ricciae]|uniref:DAGKc domain-containing protein n=1 Tax=Adineta ricciae TaxID=249248 RepID=A0A815FCY8_ADIRI|nr:unnamed protein product [Adineta ricciae]
MVQVFFMSAAQSNKRNISAWETNSMSLKAHRRRSKPANDVKQAFEENEEKKAEECRLNTLLDMEIIDLEQIHERAFFTMNNVTIELVLNKNILSWSKVIDDPSPESKNPQERTSSSNDIDFVDLHLVYAVLPVHYRRSWLLNDSDSQSTENTSSVSPTSLRGFELYSYEKTDDSSLQEIRISFQSNLPSQIHQWYRLLSKIISKYKPVQNILVICNPYSGSRYSRQVYDSKIRPILDRTQHNIIYSEISEACSVNDILSNLKAAFNALNSLIIIGGDGTVVNVINGLLHYLTQENRTRLDKDQDLPPIPFPLCIIPTGTTNIICHSIFGTLDCCTPILHLLFNQQMRIDMSAIFDTNSEFVTVNFGSAAGYAANALKYFTQPIDVVIRYIPAEQETTNMTRCFQGCPKCMPPDRGSTIDEFKTFHDTDVKTSDTYTKSLSNTYSLRKKTRPQDTYDQPWKTLENRYLHVAVLTNAGLWSLAPQGLSKFGHLADGLLDLLLIEVTPRREFVRSIKRNGNSKNQYDFPFANLIKVKEIEIELKLSALSASDGNPDCNDQRNAALSDDSSDDSEQSNNGKELSPARKYEPRPSNTSISGDNQLQRCSYYHQICDETQIPSTRSNVEDRHLPSEVDGAQTNSTKTKLSFRRKTIFQSLKWNTTKTSLPRQASVDSNASERRKHYQRSASKILEPTKSFFNLIIGGNSSATNKQDLPSSLVDRRRSSVIRRLSCVDYTRRSTLSRIQYRNRKQPCLWNLDFTPYNSPFIRIKCFPRFLPVFGIGPNPSSSVKDISYSCFGRIG